MLADRKVIYQYGKKCLGYIQLYIYFVEKLYAMTPTKIGHELKLPLAFDILG